MSPDTTFSLSYPPTQSPWWSRASLWCSIFSVDQRLLSYIWAERPSPSLSWYPPGLGFFPPPSPQGFYSGEASVLTNFLIVTHMAHPLRLLPSLGSFSLRKAEIELFIWPLPFHCLMLYTLFFRFWVVTDYIFQNDHNNTFTSQACLPYSGERRLQIPLAYSSELENRSGKGKNGNVVQRGEEARTWHAGCLSVHSVIHSTNHWQRVSNCILGTNSNNSLAPPCARLCSEHCTRITLNLHNNPVKWKLSWIHLTDEKT